MPDDRVRCGGVWNTPFAGQVNILSEFHVDSTPASEAWLGLPGTELGKKIDKYSRSLFGRFNRAIVGWLRKHCD